MKKTKKTIGIYKITSPSGAIYIGQSIDIENRFLYYKNLRCKTQKKLYYSLLKHGAENHKFEIIQICPQCKLDEFEIFYIKQYNCCNTNNGLNSTKGGRGIIGFKKEYVTYEEAKSWLKENILIDNIITDSKKWSFFNDMIPDFIPKNPLKHYDSTGEWCGWDDFLQPKCVSYEEAKKWIKENYYLKLNKKNWHNKKHKLPSFIPKNPIIYYSKNNEWVSWEDFLDRKRNNEFIPYEEAKKWIKKNIWHLDIITSPSKWQRHSYSMIPNFIPKNPHIWYKNKGWKDWEDFLSLEK